VGFLHEHKLSCEKDFHTLLQRGKVVTGFPLRFLYSVSKTSGTPSFQVAISVPKKRFHHAVDRNLAKRRIRESVRHCISNKKDFNSYSVKILIVYCDNTILPQKALEERVLMGFQKILEYAKSL